MHFKRPKFYTSFAALNMSQFFSALNDNIFKLLLVFLMITIKGPEHSNTILALVGAVFVIPFLLFASLAGSLADRFSKGSIIYFTRLLEIIIMSLGVVAFAFQTALGGYTVLFLMATQSALFSPAKYGVIPEIVAKGRISHCNGVLTATTYLAIILGTFLASFLSEVTHKNFVVASSFCVLIALVSTAVSLGIKKTKPQAATTKVSTRFIKDILATLKRARRIRYLFPTIVFGAFFLFMGAYTQLNIIPFAMQALDLSAIQGGYLFLMTAIGIGIGSFLAGRFSGKEVELGFIPLAAFGIGVALTTLFFFRHNFHVVVPLLILLGLCGGFYAVPVDAFIQTASPKADRGRNVAAANFLSFLGVILASFFIAFLGNVLDLSAASGFFIVGIMTLMLSVVLLFVMADQVMRLLIAKVGYLLWNLKVMGRTNLRLSPPALLVGPRTSWLDTVVVMATLPRLIRYIVPIEKNALKRKTRFYRLLRIIPIDIEYFAPIGMPTLHEIKKELQLGHSVCLMYPVDLPEESMASWKAALEKHLQEVAVPVIPIHISRTAPPKGVGHISQFFSLFKHPIKVSYGSKLQ
ncbi:MAG: Lysophospholipid transporter LplT [Chlamydiae bacterium]|nr:Lysophospholipid transporter LplT [Chlamydiota bacterium]